MGQEADWLDPSRAYMNGAFIPGAGEILAGWGGMAAAFRATMGDRMLADLSYGDDPRQAVDLFLPGGVPKGLLVFIHGGYWMETGRKDYSAFARGGLARGWAVALPGYCQAPGVALPVITGDVRAAVALARARVPGPMVITGHSAGGHLAARMGCDDGAKGVARVVPISPLADLAPLVLTGMQESLRITAQEVDSESPARHRLQEGVDAHVWVGGQERPAFLWQARVLSEAWSCPWTVAPGQHHFNVIDALADAASPLMAACLDGLGD